MQYIRAIDEAYAPLVWSIHILEPRLLYLYDVAVDSGEAKVLRQVSGTENSDVERFIVRRVYDPNTDLRLQIYRAIQRCCGYRLQIVVDEIPELSQRHGRAIVLSKSQLQLIGKWAIVQITVDHRGLGNVVRARCKILSWALYANQLHAKGVLLICVHI